MPHLQRRFESLLARNLSADELRGIPELTPALAGELIRRVDSIRLFAHAYSMLGNFTYGTMGPSGLLDYAYEHELAGICIHVLDGEERSLAQMSDPELSDLAVRAGELGLDVHLEISSTRRADIDQVVRMARIMSIEHIRIYSRYEGVLSTVMDYVENDLRYVATLADRYDLQFYFEQHEEFKSAEIVEILERVASGRLHVLFDFGNMVNACERPMDALGRFAPYIRQVHLKGVRVLPEGDGYGHRGVLQGSQDDDLPGPRMLFDLLMLGEVVPQVISFALEQEVGYYAPVFRTRHEGSDPFIPYRDMSMTEFPHGATRTAMLGRERRAAVNQLTYVRSVLSRLRELAECRRCGDLG